MKKILPIIIILLAPLGNAWAANFYATDYDPDYLPYNFENALEAIEYEDCEAALQEYDDTFNYMDELLEELRGANDSQPYPRSGYDGDKLSVYAQHEAMFFDQRIMKYSDLQLAAEESFRVCLIDYREHLEELEEEEQEKEAKEMAKRKEEQIAEAAKNCDLDFLNNLSTNDRMANYSRIQECEAELDQITKTEEINEERTPEVISYTPQPEPVTYTLPTKEAVEVPEILDEEVKDDEVIVATTSASTTNESKIEVTDEELEKMVQERLNEAKNNKDSEEPETKDEPEDKKPTFFKRVFSFLFGWMQ